jgi:MFS family permease
MLVASYFSDRAGSRFRFVWPFLLLSGCAFLGSYFTAAISFWLAYGFLIVACACMYAPYGPFFAIIPEMLPSNVAGEVTALVNSFGALGSFLGSYGVGMLQGMPGGTRTSFMVMGLSLLAAGGIILLLRRIPPAAPLRA